MRAATTRMIAQSNQDDGSVPTSASFLGLPLKLRRHIYGFCIPQNTIIESSFRTGDPSYWCPSPATSSDDGPQSIPEDLKYASKYLTLLRLLRVCRQITNEVEPMFYAGNSFEIPLCLDGLWDLRKFGPKQRKMMRQVTLVMQLDGSEKRALNSELWSEAFGDLSRLGFVVEQQPGPDDYRNIASMGRKKKWETTLTTVLEFLGRTLPSATQVVTDSNGQEETDQRVEAVLPGRCRFQRLPEGNFWFEDRDSEVDDSDYETGSSDYSSDSEDDADMDDDVDRRTVYETWSIMIRTELDGTLDDDGRGEERRQRLRDRQTGCSRD